MRQASRFFRASREDSPVVSVTVEKEECMLSRGHFVSLVEIASGLAWFIVWDGAGRRQLCHHCKVQQQQQYCVKQKEQQLSAGTPKMRLLCQPGIRTTKCRQRSQYETLSAWQWSRLYIRAKDINSRDDRFQSQNRLQRLASLGRS